MIARRLIMPACDAPGQRLAAEPEPLGHPSGGIVTLNLTLPPTANNLFLNARRGGRVKSPAYREWIATNGWLARFGAASSQIRGPYSLTIRIGRPDNRKRDIANLEKAISDLIVSVGLVHDDSDCQSVDIAWSEHHDGAFVQIAAAKAVPVRSKAAP